MTVAEVEVRSVGPGEYHVEIREGRSMSNHRVNVRSSTREELGVAERDEGRLVEASIHFLLERESKESILASFELSDIGRYFPEYTDEIRRRVGGA